MTDLLALAHGRIPYLPFFDMLVKGSPDESIGKKEKASPEYLKYVFRLPLPPVHSSLIHPTQSALREFPLQTLTPLFLMLCCQSYITSLHSYLLSFLARTRPLVDIVPFDEQAEKEFEDKWKEGTVEGWEVEQDGPAAGGNGEGEEGIWCSACAFSLACFFTSTSWA